MRFREAVDATAELRGACLPGLQALKESDRNRIQCADTRRLKGSIDLEVRLKDHYREYPQWDYGIGWLEAAGRECAIWVEVHPASSGHVDDMIRKVTWLKNWLRNHAPCLKSLTRVENGYAWVATAGISFRPGSPQAQKLTRAGVSFPQKQLRLN